MRSGKPVAVRTSSLIGSLGQAFPILHYFLHVLEVTIDIGVGAGNGNKAALLLSFPGDGKHWQAQAAPCQSGWECKLTVLRVL